MDDLPTSGTSSSLSGSGHSQDQFNIEFFSKELTGYGEPKPFCYAAEQSLTVGVELMPESIDSTSSEGYVLPSLTNRLPNVESGAVATLSGDPPINVAIPEPDTPQKPITRLTAARLLASIVESSGDAIISKDLNGIVTSWNKGAERLFGYTAKEMIGSPILTIIPPDRHHEEPRILRRIRHGERIEHYETVRRRRDGSLVDVSITVSPVKDSTGKVVGASKIARDITEAKEAQVRQELLTQEIHHRTRNLFAVVHSVVARSFAGKRTVQEAEAAVLGRLHALAQTHAMLNDQQAQVADLTEVIRNELSPFSGRVTIDGPRLLLVAKAAQNFALAVHELATNAAKYGALSNASGSVLISWHIDEPADTLRFRWEERGGPPVAAPTRKGFGSTVLEYLMAEYCDNEEPKVDFDQRGITYAVTCSLRAVAAADTGPSRD